MLLLHKDCLLVVYSWIKWSLSRNLELCLKEMVRLEASSWRGGPDGGIRLRHVSGEKICIFQKLECLLLGERLVFTSIKSLMVRSLVTGTILCWFHYCDGKIDKEEEKACKLCILWKYVAVKNHNVGLWGPCHFRVHSWNVRWVYASCFQVWF